MKIPILLVGFSLMANALLAQVERDDVQQVATQYNSYTGAVAGECVGAELRIPAHFELHGDQTIKLEATNIKEVRWMIFDRKGTKLFEEQLSILYFQNEEKDGKKYKWVDTGWNGSHQGVQLPEGVYVYTLNIICTDEKKMKGNGMLELRH